MTDEVKAEKWCPICQIWYTGKHVTTITVEANRKAQREAEGA